MLLGKKHIAVLLTILLGVSLLPYNALHYHQEDHHLEALYASNEDAHHCDLDISNCQGEFDKQCNHGQHLSSHHAKCFTCQFHFVKGYIGSVFYYHIPNIIGVAFEGNYDQKLIVPIRFNTGNKDPPSLV